MAHAVTLKNVSKSFGNGAHTVAVLQDLDIKVERGTFLSIVGPSGCGKTTLLNLVAGFLAPNSGHVLINESPIRGINDRLNLGYITQENRLFAWLTLQQNVGFPLKARGFDRAEREHTVSVLLEMVGLLGFEACYPYQLSGGMQKRASLAQALSYDPEILLMDEPFGSLDSQTRIQLHQELLEIWGRLDNTVIFVTHDLAEAIALSDRVVVLSRRPGTVKGQLTINLSRPRNIFQIHEHREYRECHSALWHLIEEELAPNRGRTD